MQFLSPGALYTSKHPWLKNPKMCLLTFPVCCEPNNPYQMHILEQQKHSTALVLIQENSSENDLCATEIRCSGTNRLIYKMQAFFHMHNFISAWEHLQLCNVYVFTQTKNLQHLFKTDSVFQIQGPIPLPLRAKRKCLTSFNSNRINFTDCDNTESNKWIHLFLIHFICSS